MAFFDLKEAFVRLQLILQVFVFHQLFPVRGHLLPELLRLLLIVRGGTEAGGKISRCLRQPDGGFFQRFRDVSQNGGNGIRAAVRDGGGKDAQQQRDAYGQQDLEKFSVKEGSHGD